MVPSSWLPMVSVDLEVEQFQARQELLVELDNILSSFIYIEEDEKKTEGEHTPTGPSAWGPEF